MALKSSDMISAKSYPWDSPITMETLTFTNGVIDFSNGLMNTRPGRPEEYRKSYIELTTEEVMTAKEPEAFRAMLKDIFPDEDTRKTALQAISLSVSGTGKYRKFQIWNGAGKNGKSFLMKAMQKVLGSRAITYNTNLLLQKRGADDANAVTPGLAKFQGALVAFGSETEEQKKISQGLVKNLTGDESMTARALYKDEATFETTFQVVLSTNYLPSFSAYDEAFIDRLLIIPFNTSFYGNEAQKKEFETRRRQHIVPAQDGNTLMKAIMEERAGIIRRLIRTYLDVGMEITVSKECNKWLSVYIEDNNDLGRFMETYCAFGDIDSFAVTKDIVEFFNEENNSHVTSRWLNKRLKQLHPELKSGRKRVDGSVQRGFFGMEFNQAGLALEGEEEITSLEF